MAGSIQRSKRKSDRRRLFALVPVFAAIIAAGFLGAEQLVTAQRPATPAETAQSSIKQAAMADDEIYTGSILFMPDDGKLCRQLLFDNRTGRVSDNGMVDCGRAYLQSLNGVLMQGSSVRARVISESFRRH